MINYHHDCGIRSKKPSVVGTTLGGDIENLDSQGIVFEEWGRSPIPLSASELEVGAPVVPSVLYDWLSLWHENLGFFCRLSSVQDVSFGSTWPPEG